MRSAAAESSFQPNARPLTRRKLDSVLAPPRMRRYDEGDISTLVQQGCLILLNQSGT
jgi:hypothetical protein